MDTLTCIATRRSCRKFSSRAVEAEPLDAVIQAGRCAPSGGNSRSTHFIVLTDPRRLEELAQLTQRLFSGREITPGMYRSMATSIRLSQRGVYRFHYNAPVLVIVANRRGYGNAMADSSCAMENMMLAATHLGLGSCWINQLHWLDDDPEMVGFLRALGLEEEETVCASLALGYPLEPPRSAPNQDGNPVTYVS